MWWFLAAALVAFALLPASRQIVAQPPDPPVAAGAFKPTKEQWAGLKTETVELASLRPESVTTGNIAIDDDLTTPVFSPYSGRVVRLIARPGDVVAAGAPLLAVEASEFVQTQNDVIAAFSALKTARAQLAQAELNEKRAHELYLAKGGALKDWQQSRTDLAAAQNAQRTAETSLAAARNRLRIQAKSDEEIALIESQPMQKLDATTLVVAPIGGTVTQRQVGLGQYIQSGATNPVYTIGDLSRVWLIANLREADAPLVRIGSPVEVRVAAFPGRVFTASVAWIAPSVDPNTHRLPVRAEIANPDGALKPMMFADFSIITGAPITAPAVPQSAIVYEGETARVWVASDDGTIAERTVTTGISRDGMVEIRTGLKPGEKVVTSGTLFIDRAARGS